jgi:hypothetical protein
MFSTFIKTSLQEKKKYYEGSKIPEFIDYINTTGINSEGATVYSSGTPESTCGF